jgi:BNR repeat-like domain
MKRRAYAFGSTGLAVLIAIAVIEGRRDRGPVVRFGTPGRVGTATPVGTAPMFAVSTTEASAMAWVSAPDSGTDGRLYVSVGGAAPAELRDPLGPVEAHGESPPKLAYGGDGALNAIYVVPKIVSGKRYGVAALRFTRSADGGRTWSSPVSVTDDAPFQRRHNFHALHVAADGSLYVAWLDDREGKPAPYLTRSSDNGRTWEPNRRVGSGEACPCCRTAIATTPEGTVYVAWRAVLPGNVRDIVVARSSDHGVRWTDPVRVHADDWVYPGCPHAGPSIQVDAADRLHVAWWVGKEGAAGVFYAHSVDGGRSFTHPVALGVAKYSQPAHVQMALGARGEVVVAWDDGTRAVPQIVVRVSRDGGRTFGPRTPASVPGRAAQFPVLALTDSTVTLAWSEENSTTAKSERQIMAVSPKNMPMGLKAIGATQVVIRRGHIR